MRHLLLIAAATLFAAGAYGVIAAADPLDKPAPEFPEGLPWINSKGVTLKSLQGKVVVLHFYTHGCINCIHNYPSYVALHKEFDPKEAVIVGVHTPEFDSEKNLDRIKASAEKNKLAFPIVVDNDSKIWRDYSNRYWPAVYAIDKHGKVRGRWEGELEYGEKKGTDEVRVLVKKLLAEK